MPSFKKNQGVPPSKSRRVQSREEKPTSTSNPIRGGNDNTTGIGADRMGLNEFQEQLSSTSDLLQNYRELDGKQDDAFIDQIIEGLQTMGKTRKDYAWAAVALVHGADAAAGKVMSAMGDFSINAALFLSFIVPYLFEAPNAVDESTWAKISFNICLWLSVAFFMAVIAYMIFLNQVCSVWTRDIDLIHSLFRYGGTINVQTQALFFIGLVFLICSIVIAQVATYKDPTYILFGGFLIVLVFGLGLLPGMKIYGSWPWPLVPDKDTVKFVPDAVTKAEKLIKAGVSNAEIIDIQDTPIDVLRKQNKLAKLLDDDSWRQGAMLGSVMATSFSNDNKPGTEMMPTKVGDRQDEHAENDGDQDNEQQPEAETLDSLLKALELESLLETLAAAHLDFGTLCSLAEQNAIYCSHELKEAGVTVPGHRAKIIAALLKMKKVKANRMHVVAFSNT